MSVIVKSWLPRRSYLNCYPSGITDAATSEEPPIKRRRVARGCSADVDWDEGSASENSNTYETENKVYTAELIVFDNKKHCLLTDGDYELALNEKNKKPGRKKGILSNRTSWENVFEGQVSKQGLIVMLNYTGTLFKHASLACLEIRKEMSRRLILHETGFPR